MEADSAMRQQSQELQQTRVITAELKASLLCLHTYHTVQNKTTSQVSQLWGEMGNLCPMVWSNIEIQK